MTTTSRYESAESRRKQLTHKLVLLTTAVLLMSEAGAHAQGDHHKNAHARAMSSHARLLDHDSVAAPRNFTPASMAPESGDQGTSGRGFEKMDDPSAEGRTSGG
jgi:hypothetical protein